MPSCVTGNIPIAQFACSLVFSKRDQGKASERLIKYDNLLTVLIKSREAGWVLVEVDMYYVLCIMVEVDMYDREAAINKDSQIALLTLTSATFARQEKQSRN